MTKFMKVLGSSSKALGFMGVLLPSMGLHTPQCLLLKDLTGSARYTRPPNPTACPPAATLEGELAFGALWRAISFYHSGFKSR